MTWWHEDWTAAEAAGGSRKQGWRQRQRNWGMGGTGACAWRSDDYKGSRGYPSLRAKNPDTLGQELYRSTLHLPIQITRAALENAHPPPPTPRSCLLLSVPRSQKRQLPELLVVSPQSYEPLISRVQSCKPLGLPVQPEGLGHAPGFASTRMAPHLPRFLLCRVKGP